MSNAIVLLSGGLDSATTLAIAKSAGHRITALTFRYGQRHAVEVDAARRVAKAIGVHEHLVLDIDLRVFGKSALTDNVDVPKDRTLEQMNADVPVTYVPARNTVFLSYALACAETRDAFDIFIGVNALDYSGYPDCRPEYIGAYEAMANLATRDAVESDRQYRIHTPVIEMTKSDIIRYGRSVGIDYSCTSTCYEATSDGIACGKCDACILRLEGFSDCGIEDPIQYRPAEKIGL